MSVLSSDFSGTISLLKPDLSVLASTPVGPGRGFLDTTVLPVAGTYTFVVDPSGATTGSISFTAYDVPADPSSAITAGGPAVTLTTTVPGQNANATFTGTAGQKVSVLVSNVVNADPAELDLLKPDGSHAIPAPVTVTNAGAWMQTVTLTVNGVYKILLDPQLANTGSADVQLFIGAARPQRADHAWHAAHGDDHGSRSERDLHLHRRDQHAREPRPHGGVDREFEGLRPEARRHESHREDRGRLGRLRRSGELPVGGAYKVFVDPQSSFFGSVTVGVYVVPADTTGTLVLGTPLTVSTTVPGQNATRTFNGTAGQRISFNFTGVTMASVKVIVKAPGTSADGPPAHVWHRRRLRRPGDAARGPHRPVHRDDRPAGGIDGQRDADVLQRPRRRERLDELRKHRPGAELQAHAHGQLGNAHGDGDDERPHGGRPDAERLAHDLPGHDDHAGEPDRLQHSRTCASVNDFEVLFPANGTYTIVVDQFGAATGTTSVAIS